MSHKKEIETNELFIDFTKLNCKYSLITENPISDILRRARIYAILLRECAVFTETHFFIRFMTLRLNLWLIYDVTVDSLQRDGS